MTGEQISALGSAQLNFLCDQLEYPENTWTTMSWEVRLPIHLNEHQARHLMFYISSSFEALRGRMTTGENGYRQRVASVEEFLEKDFSYLRADRPLHEEDLPVKTLDAFVRSAYATVVDEPAGATVHFLTHHAFFDNSATQVLGTALTQAAGHQAVIDGSASPEDASASIQPRHVKAFELKPAGARSTQRWIDFHRTPRRTAWSQTPPPRGGLVTQYNCMLTLENALSRRLHAAAQNLSISISSLLNSIVCAYAGELSGQKEVTLKTVCSNRFLPAFQTAVSCISADTWISQEMEGVGSPAWHQKLSAQLLNSYRYGLYDWDRVRRSPNFFSPFRSVQTISTNIMLRDFPPSPSSTDEHPAEDEPVLEWRDLLPVPHSLSHDLSVFVEVGSTTIRLLVKTLQHCIDEQATTDLTWGLHRYLLRQFEPGVRLGS